MNSQRELLLCYATGSSRWDIPKGIGEPGETEVETAIREAAEECGLTFEPDSLLDLGRYPYRRVKDLYLYAALIERIDTAVCGSLRRSAIAGRCPSATSAARSDSSSGVAGSAPITRCSAPPFDRAVALETAFEGAWALAVGTHRF